MAEKRRKNISKPVAPMRVVKGAATQEQDTATREQQVRKRAYERFVARGYVHGHALEDGLAAEVEI